ncbi:MAG: DNA double-strand break repair nuclease NurA [Candidatus Bathyarchaeia archaeon]
MHFRWVSACFAHAVASSGSLLDPGRWTIPSSKGHILAFTLYRERTHDINSHIRGSVELTTAFQAAKKHVDEKPVLLLDGSIATLYHTMAIARKLSASNFFVNEERLVDEKWMAEEAMSLLDDGVRIVGLSKDTRVKYLPMVERKGRDVRGKIVVADPIEFAGEDLINRKLVPPPPYIWLLFVRLTDRGRVYRVEIALRGENEKDLSNISDLLCLLKASVEVDEPRMAPTRRVGYPYPLACADALARVTADDAEWLRHEILMTVKNYYPFLQEFFGPETREAVHTR